MKNILVVDDDDSYVYLVKRRVCALDNTAQVHSCGSGQEALSYLEALPPNQKVPDLLILDLNMPVMNGFDFLEAYGKICQQRHVEIPPPAIWIVTSSNAASDKERAHQFPFARGYLVKPLGKKDIEDLLTVGC